MIGEVLNFSLGAFAIGGAGMFASSRKVDKRKRRERWIKFAVYFAVLNGVLILAGLGRTPFTALMLAIVAMGAYELHRAPLPVRSLRALIWSGYIVLGAGLIAFALLTSPGQATFVYLTVALFDGFSQVFGQLLGKRPLARAISPSKTIEGAAGGGIAAVLSSVFLGNMTSVGPNQAIAGSVVIVMAALAGDLAASWIKRRAGIKDFGSLLPGHGGVLDRFDSLLVAAPVWSVLFLVL